MHGCRSSHDCLTVCLYMHASPLFLPTMQFISTAATSCVPRPEFAIALDVLRKELDERVGAAKAAGEQVDGNMRDTLQQVRLISPTTQHAQSDWLCRQIVGDPDAPLTDGVYVCYFSNLTGAQGACGRLC